MSNRDQAELLRERVQRERNKSNEESAARRKVHLGRTIAVTSGKGGVGKSSFSLNFAIQLQKLGYQTVIFDADLGLSNLDVLLGITPRHSLQDLLQPDTSVFDVLERGPHGLYLLPGSAGLYELGELSLENRQRLLHQLNELQQIADFIIIDTGAGLREESLSLLLAADDIVVVMTPEPTSLTDGYAVLKYLYKQSDELSLWVVINRTTNRIEAEQTGNKIRRVVRRFLNKDVRILGYIPESRAVIQAVKQQQPFSDSFPNSTVTQRLYLLTQRYVKELTGKEVQQNNSGLLNFLQKMFWKSG